MVQWLRFWASNAGVTGSIPGQGIKIPHATWCGWKAKQTTTTTKKLMGMNIPWCLHNFNKSSSKWWNISNQTDSFSHVQVFGTPQTVAHEAPLSIGFSQARILEWVVISSPRGIFPTQGSNPCLQYWQVDSLPLSHMERLASINGSHQKVVQWSNYDEAVLVFKGEWGTLETQI